MPKQPDYPVMIPYSELCRLLDATKQIEMFRDQVKVLDKQVLALRIMQQECFEKLREIEKYL